jgi:transcriptional regulator with XRE-family HTH domain
MISQLADGAVCSGMDRSAVSRLANGVCLNPTVDSLYCYAQAIKADIGLWPEETGKVRYLQNM